MLPQSSIVLDRDSQALKIICIEVLIRIGRLHQ
jgi:hypothetical protein